MQHLDTIVKGGIKNSKVDTTSKEGRETTLRSQRGFCEIFIQQP